MTEPAGYFCYVVQNGILSRWKYRETGYRSAETREAYERIEKAKYPLTEEQFDTLSLDQLERKFPVPAELREFDRLPMGPLPFNEAGLRRNQRQ